MTARPLELCWQQLGITANHIDACAMPEVTEATELISAGLDIFDREQQMTPETFSAWQKMLSAAEADNVVIQLVSAYRSVEYQVALIQRKLDAGQQIEDILNVNAPPGFSEHHTGRALDLTTPGCEVLTEEFESTVAFNWLNANAETYGFSLSYPRGNPSGIDYEPWHWAHHD